MKTINQKQHTLYLITWAKVKALLLQLKVVQSHKEAEAKRHEISREALGNDKSSKLFTNADLDRVLDAFQTYLGLADPRVSKRAVEEPRKRLLYAIEQLGFPDTYVMKIALAQFNKVNWRVDLNETQLGQLKMTITMRARARDRKEKEQRSREADCH